MVSSSGINHLNLLTLPLTGRTLIEASAGTGKTYSIAFIYLRLLLGIGENSYQRRLNVDEILVVTFTKAATQELRSRIRQNIHELRLGLLQGHHSDPIYQQLIALISDRNDAIKILSNAQQVIDEAAIYTIHSFCQRILTTYAFRSGVLFEHTLVKDETSLRLQVVQDFWRDYFIPLDKSVAYVVLQYWQDPNTLLRDLLPYFNEETKRSSLLPSDFIKKLNQFCENAFAKIAAIKAFWQAACSEIENCIIKSGVDKRSYSSRNLPNWLTQVSNWALSSVNDFNLPIALTKFSQSELIIKTQAGKEAPCHPLFVAIDVLLAEMPDLRRFLVIDIAEIVWQGIYTEKIKRGEMGFDDLLLLLNQALQSQHGVQLAQSIATDYCVAMIDEFQDTDKVQYQIFDLIYQDKKNTGLLFIGDPKQAIYSFRGADIFTYLNAKQSIADNHFTMDINWRSSLDMVTAVNQLFSNSDNPFVFDTIPFLKMHAADKNKHKQFIINNKKINALNAYCLSDASVTVDAYHEQMAICCASQIVTWLSEASLLCNSQHEQRAVTAADIAILVRNKKEAEIIQQKLIQVGVPSVYLSNHNSVFATPEAKDMLCLLQAVLMPENESVLRTALMTHVMGLTMTQIQYISDDQEQWDIVIEEFKQYQLIWLRYGILVMLRRLMKKRHLAENMLAHQNGERLVTNFMHLGELLQEASYELDSPYAVVRFLIKQISEPDLNLENHEQRLESDENLVKVITVHKSKGLEFPLVWIPFIANYHEANTFFYHDKENNYQLKHVWQLTDAIKQQIEAERVAEDLRLLYVAMTRAIYHCSIGLARLKKSASAINYLLNNDINTIATMAELIFISELKPVQYYQPKVTPLQPLTAKIFKRRFNVNWRVTSYSELQQHKQVAVYHASIENSWDAYQESNASADVTAQHYDIHHFPKGALVGTLLHQLMEDIDVSHSSVNNINNNNVSNNNVSNSNIDSLSNELIHKLNLDTTWQNTLSDWIKKILLSPLNSSGLSLLQILQGKHLNELQFYLPIKQAVTSQAIDLLCKEYDSLSLQCPALNFATVQGMLKGFIDVVFEWQGKFYIIDYKSNWLGDSELAYTPDAIHKVMCEHRYEFQYQLYTLALHRFLKNRLPNYHYQQHIGGVYYLFLRGLPHQGIFYNLPEAALITQLDQLFEGAENNQ